MVCGPLGNGGSAKGGQYTGGCYAYEMTPNMQFGELLVSPDNIVRFRGHRVAAELSDSLDTVFEFSVSMPFKPVNGSFKAWAAETCAIQKMPSKDAAELACFTGLLTLGSALLCLLSARICGGRLKLQRPSSCWSFAGALAFWLLLWALAVLVCFVVYAIFGLTFARPDIDLFSARSGLGIGIAAGLTAQMLVLIPYLLCQCSIGRCVLQGRCETRAVALLVIIGCEADVSRAPAPRPQMPGDVL